MAISPTTHREPSRRYETSKGSRYMETKDVERVPCEGCIIRILLYVVLVTLEEEEVYYHHRSSIDLRDLRTFDCSVVLWSSHPNTYFRKNTVERRRRSCVW